MIMLYSQPSLSELPSSYFLSGLLFSNHLSFSWSRKSLGISPNLGLWHPISKTFLSLVASWLIPSSPWSLCSNTPTSLWLTVIPSPYVPHLSDTVLFVTSIYHLLADYKFQLFIMFCYYHCLPCSSTKVVIFLVFHFVIIIYTYIPST